jgi:hypothetical protein
MRGLVCAVLALSMSAPALAKSKKGGGHAKLAAPNARAIGELAGKFKWGMSHEDVVKIVTEQVHGKYVELVKKEQDVYKQDQLRQAERDEVQKVRDSYVQFDGQKTGWDVSIVDKEFAQRNSESMLVMWEKDQRRFLFFYNGQLYKQYIAFNAEHPVFAGKTFDDFAKLIQNRYGPAEMKFAQLRTKDDMALDHLEWPASGEFQLWAIDQSSFYGNFCLVLFHPQVSHTLEAAREAHSNKGPRGNALIDSVTQPEKISGDANENIVDQITGRSTKK